MGNIMQPNHSAGNVGKYTCVRCGWNWTPRSNSPDPPRACARCRSAYWQSAPLVPAWFANLLVICGCVWAYSRLGKRRLSDIWGFVAAFALTTGFFALDMALFQARYLAIFPRMLHP